MIYPSIHPRADSKGFSAIELKRNLPMKIRSESSCRAIRRIYGGMGKVIAIAATCPLSFGFAPAVQDQGFDECLFEEIGSDPIDCEQVPECKWVEFNSSSDSVLSLEELVSAANFVLEKRMIDEEITIDQGADEGTASFTLTHGDCERQIELTILPPNEDARKDGVSGEAVSETNSNSTVEKWTIEVFTENLKRKGSSGFKPEPLDGSRGAGEVLSVLNHEILHVCLGLSGESTEPLSCEHYIIARAEAQLLCKLAILLEARRDTLNGWLLECGDDLDEEEFEKLAGLNGGEFGHVLDTLSSVCSAYKGLQAMWNTKEGVRAATLCITPGESGATPMQDILERDCCGIDPISLPDNGFVPQPDDPGLGQPDPPAPPEGFDFPIPDCPGCD